MGLQGLQADHDRQGTQHPAPGTTAQTLLQQQPTLTRHCPCCCLPSIGQDLDTLMTAFDRNKDGQIDFDEFLRGIRVRFPSAVGAVVPLTGKHTQQQLCTPSHVFVVVVFAGCHQGKLNKQRRDIILQAFDKLDKDGSGIVTVAEVADCYDVTQHPDVLGGSKTEEQVIKQFMRQWETTDQDGRITRDEFLDYYKVKQANQHIKPIPSYTHNVFPPPTRM